MNEAKTITFDFTPYKDAECYILKLRAVGTEDWREFRSQNPQVKAECVVGVRYDVQKWTWRRDVS